MTFDNARLTPDMVGLKPVRLFWGCIMCQLGWKMGIIYIRIYLGAGPVLLVAFELRNSSERVSVSTRRANGFKSRQLLDGILGRTGERGSEIVCCSVVLANKQKREKK